MRSGLVNVLSEMKFEGVEFEILHKEIEPGDLYLAERNTGVHLLTCLRNDKSMGCIYPVENAYPYDTHECIPVKFILRPEDRGPVYGKCTSCGAIETKLNKQTHTIDYSYIGESSVYPAGYGCELCM